MSTLYLDRTVQLIREMFEASERPYYGRDLILIRYCRRKSMEPNIESVKNGAGVLKKPLTLIELALQRGGGAI